MFSFHPHCVSFENWIHFVGMEHVGRAASSGWMCEWVNEWMELPGICEIQMSKSDIL